MGQGSTAESGLTYAALSFLAITIGVDAGIVAGFWRARVDVCVLVVAVDIVVVTVGVRID